MVLKHPRISKDHDRNVYQIQMPDRSIIEKPLETQAVQFALDAGYTFGCNLLGFSFGLQEWLKMAQAKEQLERRTRKAEEVDLIIFKDASDMITLHVVEPALYDEIQRYSETNRSAMGAYDWQSVAELTFKLLYGENGELFEKNPRVLATYNVQTFAPEAFKPQGALVIKRIFMIPWYPGQRALVERRIP